MVIPVVNLVLSCYDHLIIDPLPLPFQHLLGLASAWTQHSQVPVISRRRGTSTVPRPGAVKSLYMAAAEVTRTTSSQKGAARRSVVKG